MKAKKRKTPARKTPARKTAPRTVTTTWPANPQLNVAGSLEPLGPVNVFNEKVAIADAVNRATDIKTAYDSTHPPVTVVVDPPPEPTGPLIGAGAPIAFDQSRYLIDIAFTGARIIPRRR